MRIEGLPVRDYKLLINDVQAVRATAKELAKLKVEVGSGGMFTVKL